MFLNVEGGNREFWIDGNDVAVERNWVRWDGERMQDIGHWMSGEPNSYYGMAEEDCRSFQLIQWLFKPATNGWNDRNCANKLKSICEITIIAA
jgi:hypothetical protein